MNLIIEYQYFPPAILFKTAYSCTHFILEQYENYQKIGFRNRCVIAGANGSIVLSVPLSQGRNQKCLTKEISIDNRSRWQARHWKTITSCYNRSPWFEFYADELHELYQTIFDKLVDWNTACLLWTFKKLELTLPVRLTDDWKPKYTGKDDDDWRNRLTPRSVNRQFPDYPRYRQVYQERTGFVPHLSILDLLLCEGKNARLILEQ